MVKNFDEFQQISKDNVDAAMKSFGAVSKNFQVIAAEISDYSKKSFEEGSAAFEKLVGAKSLDKAIEIQSDYAKSAYESFVSEANKLTTLYSDLAKDFYKPFEGYFEKLKPVA